MATVAQAPSLRRAQAGFYQHESSCLFVPTPLMWSCHDAANPVASVEDARTDTWQKSAKVQLREWEEQFPPDHWFWNWIYEGIQPDDIRLIYPSGSRHPLTSSADRTDFRVTSEMQDFRQRSTLTGLAAAKPGSDHSGTLSAWLSKWPELKPWLQRGLKPPDGWRLATPATIEHARKAWNARKICELTETEDLRPVADRTYHHWVRDLFPRNDLLGWMRWLFGEELPAGWYLIDRRIAELRSRTTPQGTAAAAGVEYHKWYEWMADPQKREALADAKRCPGREPRSQVWRNAFYEGANKPRICADQRDAFLRIAKKSSFASALRDSALTPTRWAQILRDAGESADALKRFVNGDPELPPGANGAIAAGLFLPSEGMLRFRKVAKRRSRIGKGSGTPIFYLLCQNYGLPSPCVDQWFLDWTLPGEHWRRDADGRISGKQVEPEESDKTGQATDYDVSNWPEDTPHNWAKRFDVSWKTVRRRIDQNIILGRQVHKQLWRIHPDHAK